MGKEVQVVALMGIDVGTTGSKCTIFDVEGNVCSYAYREYDVENPSRGHFELNPEIVWEAVKWVMANAIKKHEGREVKAICISSFGESAVPIDKNGRVLYNSFLYTDVRGSKQCESLKDKIGLESLMNLTGLPAHPMYTISKIMWIRENLPEVYKNTWKFLLFEDFVVYRLCNETVIDYSLASRTMAFNITEKRWESKVLKEAEIDRDIFSCAVPSGSVVGIIKGDVAEELGLAKNVKIVTGGHDQVCAAIGGGIIRERMAINGIGTVECITPGFSRPFLNHCMLKNNFACVPHAKDGMYVTYAFNFTGGSLLKWYRDNFALYDKLEAQKLGENVYAMLDKKAANTPTNLLVLPHFSGAGTPYMDTSAKGAIMGLDFETTQAKFYRALLEGVNYEMMYNLECLGNVGIEIDELRAVGGGAKSDLWLQIKADIMNKKIIALDVDEAGTLGTAILAGVAIGEYKSLEKAVETLVKVRKVFYPNLKNHQIYTENYYRYKKMYKAVKETMS
jgi:xylulokinase